MLEKMPSDINDRHERWYKKVVMLAESIETVLSKRRTIKRQIHRENVPAKSSKEYYRKASSVPLLDHLIWQIHTSFYEANLNVLDVHYGMPNVISNSDWKTGFTRFLEKYKEDLPEPNYVDTELETWNERCHQIAGTLPSLLQDLPLF